MREVHLVLGHFKGATHVRCAFVHKTGAEKLKAALEERESQSGMPIALEIVTVPLEHYK